MLLSFSICNAQQFEFQMKFVDAVGNTDSIKVGYDQAATDSLDISFGEMNIASAPYSSGLDIRIGNEIMQSSFSNFGEIIFETKKQILPDVCGTLNFWSESPIAEIHILSNHFPIKATWNKVLFNDSCRNGSVFTSVHPGGWWDVGGFREVLKTEDSITFYPNKYYYHGGADTVNAYWIAFYDSTILIQGINQLSENKNAFKVFPNPASDIITIEVHNPIREINQVSIYNSIGKLILSANQLTNINVSDLPQGLYFIRIINRKEISSTAKFQKL